MKGFSLKPNRIRRRSHHRQRISLTGSQISIKTASAYHQNCFWNKQKTFRRRKRILWKSRTFKNGCERSKTFFSVLTRWSLKKYTRFIIYNPWAWRQYTLKLIHIFHGISTVKLWDFCIHQNGIINVYMYSFHISLKSHEKKVLYPSSINISLGTFFLSSFAQIPRTYLWWFLRLLFSRIEKNAIVICERQHVVKFGFSLCLKLSEDENMF